MKYRPPAELFDGDTINSLRGIPITNEHPQERGNFTLIDSDNYKKFAMGTVSEPEQDADNVHLKGVATIWDKGLINQIVTKKKTEVSLGYTREDDFTPGQFDGTRYDVIQRKIRANHLAVTTAGRSGKSVRLEIDSKGKIKKSSRSEKMKKYLIEIDGKISENPEMKTTKLSNGSDVQCEAEIHDEIQSYRSEIKKKQSEIDSSNAKIKDLEKSVADFDSEKTDREKNLQLEIDTRDASIKALKKDLEDKESELDSRIEKGVNETIEVQSNAKNLEIDSAGKNVMELKKAIINKSLDVDAEALPEDQIDAYYKASIAVIKKESMKTKSSDNDSADGDAYAERELELKKLNEEQ